MLDDSQLDDSQRAVLDVPVGDHAVVFGVAGSGKTHTVVSLVAAARAREGWTPSDVLAIAGTRQAATALRDALSASIDGISYGPMARTAPSLAFAVFAAAETAAGRDRPLLMTGAEQDRRLADLLAGYDELDAGPQWPDHLGPLVREQQGFRTELRDVIARARERGMNAAALGAHDRGDGAWKAVAQCMQDLDDVLALEHRDRSVVDAAALLHAAAQAVSRTESIVLPRLIVVDDAQELTLGAVELLTALAARGCAVIALGDPDTATGMFRGADPTLMATLPSRIGGTWHRLELHCDWRQPTALAEVRRRTSAHIGAALAATHRAAPSAFDGGTVRVLECASDAEQALMIARLLRERHVLHGIAWHDMGVIVRSQSVATSLARSLSSSEVPTHMQSPAGGRADSAVRDLMEVLGVVTGRCPLDVSRIHQWLQSPLVGLDAVGVRRLRRLLRQAALLDDTNAPASGDSLLTAAFENPTVLDALDHRVARAAKRAALSLAEARRQVADDHAAESVLWGLWERAQVADAWKTVALGHGQDAIWANRRLDAVVALFDRAARFAEQRPDALPGEFYDDWIAAAVDADSLAARTKTDAVAVGTPSSFVSRSLDTVIVAAVQDGSWPNLKPQGSLLGAAELGSATSPAGTTDVFHDELRLFTHAVSRARDTLIVTAVADESSMPSKFFSMVGEPTAGDAISTQALTLRGLVAQLRLRLTEDPSDADAAAGLARLAAAHVPGAHPDEWAGLAASSSTSALHDGQVRVSPSQIASFSECALQWVVSQLSHDSSGMGAQIGTVVHSAVEHAEPTQAALMAHIDEHWEGIEFQADWESSRQREIVAEMAARIEDYFAKVTAEGWHIDRGDHERRFAVAVGDALLAGSIDWIERRGTTIRIADLKTGTLALNAQALQEHPQLQAYQLAVARGAIGDAETENGGAVLVVPKSEPKKVVLAQDPLDAAALEAFATVVETAAKGMAAAVFEAKPTTHCLSSRLPVPCTIHTVREVTE